MIDLMSASNEDAKPKPPIPSSPTMPPSNHHPASFREEQRSRFDLIVAVLAGFLVGIVFSGLAEERKMGLEAPESRSERFSGETGTHGRVAPSNEAHRAGD